MFDPRETQDIFQPTRLLGASLREQIEREKHVENQLRHTERLANFGRRVAGVAHEVRNPLSTIPLRVQMCGRTERGAYTFATKSFTILFPTSKQRRSGELYRRIRSLTL